MTVPAMTVPAMTATAMTAGRTGSSGFTLVEVLVASAIAVASIGILINLFAGSLDRLSRIEDRARQIVVEKEIVTRLSLINPAQEPSGQGAVGAWRYQWQSEPEVGFRRLADYFHGDSPPRLIALFQVSVQIAGPDGTRKTLKIKRMGWKEP